MIYTSSFMQWTNLKKRNVHSSTYITSNDEIWKYFPQQLNSQYNRSVRCVCTYPIFIFWHVGWHSKQQDLKKLFNHYHIHTTKETYYVYCSRYTRAWDCWFNFESKVLTELRPSCTSGLKASASLFTPQRFTPGKLAIGCTASGSSLESK